MKRIGVDIDEVLSETLVDFLMFYNEENGTNFKPEQFIEYSFTKILGITSEQEKLTVMKFFGSEYFANMTTVKDSVEVISRLAKRFELYAVSSRPEQIAELTKIWLDKHYPGCFKEIVLTNSHFNPTSTKSGVCVNKQLNYFIEDTIRYAADCASVGLTVFLLDKPWNRLEIGKNIIRATNWLDIEKKLNLGT